MSNMELGKLLNALKSSSNTQEAHHSDSLAIDRPYVTSFMLMSLDGKISFSDDLKADFDRHIPMLSNASEGLHWYYDTESNTDAFSIISSAICNKLEKEFSEYHGPNIDCVCVVLDRSCSVSNEVLAGLGRKFKLVIHYSNSELDPNYRYEYIKSLGQDNVIFEYCTDLKEILSNLKTSYGAERVTLQTGGRLNSEFMRLGLIDRLDYVVAPIVCGGTNTPALFNGEAFATCCADDVENAVELSFVGVTPLGNSYIRLIYDVIKCKEDC